MTNKERFKDLFVNLVQRPGAEDLLVWLGTTDFFEAPASTRFHCAFPGGLVEHSLNVYDQLLFDHSVLKYDGQTLAVCALLHDVCKANYYHGEKSVYLIQKYVDLTDEEALAIRWHMGAYDEAYRGGSRALGEAQERCALVLALHQADMRATQQEKLREGL